MTVKRRKDTQTPRVLMHKLADIRGGVSVNVTELGGDFLPEGAVLSAPIDGICHVVKIAKLTEEAGSSDTTIKVAKGHNLLVGDVVMADEGGKAYPITKIDKTNSASDAVTVSTTLGVKIEKDAFLIQAKAESSTTASALKYVPLAISGTGKPVVQGQNFDTDAWVMAVTKGNPLPDCVKKHLTGIINY